jgi:regulator of protease activity HflC (stomatin/prohibitin superfamily)
MIRERSASTFSGWLVLPSLIVGFGLTLWLLIATAVSVEAAADERIPVGGGWVALIIFCILGLILLALMPLGFFAVNPNEARVMTLFGRYKGSVKTDGFHWVNPLFKRRKISLRIRNFESSQIKVNDLEGNPIEIAAVVVWRVVETAEAMFEVENFEHYVKVQTETALRNMATHYPYDAYVEEHLSLRANTAEIAEKLKTEVQERLGKAGVEVLEARINHLAYATEIAAAMLQRQQAGAIIAARSRIVEGAVGMVEMALDLLSKRGVVTLDNERKAAMVSNLLVVLCGDRNTQPVVNTGTIYQ